MTTDTTSSEAAKLVAQKEKLMRASHRFAKKLFEQHFTSSFQAFPFLKTLDGAIFGVSFSVVPNSNPQALIESFDFLGTDPKIKILEVSEALQISQDDAKTFIDDFIPKINQINEILSDMGFVDFAKLHVDSEDDIFVIGTLKAKKIKPATP